MGHITLFESFDDRKANTGYDRVIPRDLFNESKLLKCMGQLCLYIHDNTTPVEMTVEHNGDPFKIALMEDNNLRVTNISISIKGSVFDFYTTYNSKAAYPLYVMDDNYTEYEVFDHGGKFSTEFVEFCESL